MDSLDDNLSNQDVSIDQGFLDASDLVHSTSAALEEATVDGKLTTTTQRFADRMLDSTVDFLTGEHAGPARRKFRQRATIALWAVLSVACQPSVVGPVSSIADSTPINTEAAPSPTATPTIAATPTPESTPTPDISHFKVCSPEQYQECPLPPETLMDGSYLAFLNTLSKPFDPAQLRQDLTLVWNHDFIGMHVIYYANGPNFTDPGSAPFRRDVTAGYTEVVDSHGNLHKYAVLPVEYFDKDEPDENKWVITVNDFYVFNSKGRQINDAEIRGDMYDWQHNMKSNPLVYGHIIPINSGNPSPLVTEVYMRYPDMRQRFSRFVEGDLSALSAKGIVVLTFAGRWPNHMFE